MDSRPFYMLMPLKGQLQATFNIHLPYLIFRLLRVANWDMLCRSLC
jgi:hypothetical protein